MRQGKILKFITSLVTVGVLVYLGLCAYYYAMQGRMIYLPAKTLSASPGDIGLAYEPLTLTTADGLAISAWFIPAKEARATLLFCHGNAGNIASRLDSVRIMNALGLDVLIFDYRGFGQSQGEPDEQGTYVDAEAAWRYLVKDREIAPQRVIIFGRSLGSAVAAEMSLRHPDAGGLILESGFTSIADVARDIIPYLPVDLLVRYRYATKEKVGRILMPKLIVHSPDDEVIPFHHGTQLFQIAAPPKTFLQIRGSHNGGFLESGSVYTQGLNRFVSDIAGRAPDQ